MAARTSPTCSTRDRVLISGLATVMTYSCTIRNVISTKMLLPTDVSYWVYLAHSAPPNDFEWLLKHFPDPPKCAALYRDD